MNRIFNFKIWIEGVRQLKIIGLISSILLGVYGLMISLGTIISKLPFKNNEIISSDFSSDLLPMVAIFVIFVPLMMMALFHFLNNRSSSDFYHSLPVKRSALYISFIMAVIAWVLILILIGCLIPILVYRMESHVYWDRETLLPFVCSVFAGSILVMGAFAISISITGTGFTNVIVACMIIFVPRLLMTYIISACTQILPFISLDYSHILTGDYRNLVYGFFASTFVSGNLEMNQFSGAIYTLVVGVVYLVAGGILFVKRQSETASKPSMNQVLQSILRIIPAFIISIVGTVLWIHNIKYCVDQEPTNVFKVFIWYILALLVYFIYELITTRRWSKTVSSVKQLPIIVALNIILAILLLFAFDRVTKELPTSQEITAIRIEELPVDAYIYNGNKKVSITSDIAKELVATNLKEEMEAFLDNPCADYGANGNEQQTTLAIETDSKVIHRIVYMSEAEVNTLLKELTKSKGYNTKKNVLPKYHSSLDLYSSNYSFSGMDCVDLYKNLVEEYGTIDNMEDLIHLNEMDQFESINVYSDKDDDYYYLPITWKTPKTVTLLSEYVNSLYPDFQISSEKLLDDSWKYYSLFYSFELWVDGTCYYANYDMESVDGENLEDLSLAFEKILSGHEEDRVTTDENILVIQYDLSGGVSEEDSVYEDGVRFYNLNAAETDALKDLLEFERY